MRRIVSLFSGIDGLGLGLEWAGLGETAVHVEIEEYARLVLRRHWPSAQQFPDVRAVRGEDLGEVWGMVGGFPCQDISNAGKRVGIEGERSGLWKEYARLIREARPRWVVIENVRALKRRGLDVVLEDLHAAGYDVPEVIEIAARDVGAPHRRDRIFILAIDRPRTCDAPAFVSGADLVQAQATGEVWPTPTATGNYNRAELAEREASYRRRSGDGLHTAVMTWATPIASDAGRGAGSRRGNGGPASSLPAHVLEDERAWPTPVARDTRGEVLTPPKDGQTEALSHAVAWPTPTAVAYGSSQNGICAGKPSGGTPSLWTHAAAEGGRLNPAWIEALMGFPVGWTATLNQLDLFAIPPAPIDRTEAPIAWPAGRGAPQYDWEPRRSTREIDPNWDARIHALGNAVVPHVARTVGLRLRQLLQAESFRGPEGDRLERALALEVPAGEPLRLDPDRGERLDG